MKLIFFLPNISLKNNKLFSEKKINLGLDLQGGSYLLLEIDSEPLIMQRLQAKSLEIRRALREKNIQYKDFNFTGKSLFFNYEIKQKNNIDQLLNEKSINSNIKTGGKSLGFV